MRIIAGRFKGRRLASPVVKGVRPTTDKVREAVFSAIGRGMEGCRILDLFAGTGSFGFEALSRGASGVVFVESNRQMAASIDRTAQLLGVHDLVTILAMDASRAVNKLAKQGATFSMVFLDPPYEAGLLKKMLCDPMLVQLFTSNGMFIVESGDLTFESQVPDIFKKRFQGTYGGTSVTSFDVHEVH